MKGFEEAKGPGDLTYSRTAHAQKVLGGRAQSEATWPLAQRKADDVGQMCSFDARS
jgi:hypothetical protein